MYEDASRDELKTLLKQFLKIKAEYGQEKRPEIDERIKFIKKLLKEGDLNGKM